MGMLGNMKPTNATSQTTQQSDASWDPFDVIGKGQPSQRSNYIDAGVYPVLYCEQLKLITSKTTPDRFFIAEFTIIESKVASRPEGTVMSWVCNLRHPSSGGNVREFIAALANDSIEQVDAEVARYATSEKNPMRGRLIRLEATQVKTKKGGDFTRCRWVALPEDAQKQAEDIRTKACEMPF
jgi:hypothetical protein